MGAGKKAGTSSDSEGNLRVGPFVDFVQAAVEFLELNTGEMAHTDLGNRIRSALRIIKNTLPAEGGNNPKL